MTAVAFFASAAAAFLLGFIIGTLSKGRGEPASKATPVLEEELQKLRREYSNFLSYDGTEQSQR